MTKLRYIFDTTLTAALLCAGLMVLLTGCSNIQMPAFLGGGGAGAPAAGTSGAATAGPTPALTSASNGASANSSTANATPAAGASVAPPPPPVLPFDQALQRAADAVFNGAEKVLAMPSGDKLLTEKRELIIDPLIDASTGQQTVGSVQMGKWLTDYVVANRKAFTPTAFNRASLGRAPILMIGTLTAVNSKGDATARADAYRVWLTLVDLRTGRVIAKSIQRASEETVDSRPTEFFRDTPTWVKDRTVAGYINSCQVNTKVGDPIDATYLQHLTTAASINEAIDAYNERRYADAFRLYSEASAASDPDDLRVLNGMYLSAWKLRRYPQALESLDQIVGVGLRSKKLSLKILFAPGGTDFVGDAQARQQYPTWIRTVASKAANSKVCLNVVGHTSHTGSPELNDALSARRARSISTRLLESPVAPGEKIGALGVGYRENLVGLGTDDVRDALDRRVEFRVVDCPQS